jgi:hypothetical protein
MSDKRAFPRLKKRLMVEFHIDGEHHTGFTHDLSYTGFFVVASKLPKPGSPLTAVLHLPNGKRLELAGSVVRARRVPPQLTAAMANGFSLQLGGYSEDYTRFVDTLH